MEKNKDEDFIDEDWHKMLQEELNILRRSNFGGTGFLRRRRDLTLGGTKPKKTKSTPNLDIVQKKRNKKKLSYGPMALKQKQKQIFDSLASSGSSSHGEGDQPIQTEETDYNSGKLPPTKDYNQVQTTEQEQGLLPQSTSILPALQEGYISSPPLPHIPQEGAIIPTHTVQAPAPTTSLQLAVPP